MNCLMHLQALFGKGLQELSDGCTTAKLQVAAKTHKDTALMTHSIT